jgi:Mrp family chromosome partitioning ATPase
VNDIRKPPDKIPSAGSRSTLKIEYSETRVISEAAAHIRSHRAIVGKERSPTSEAFKVLRAQLLQRMRAQGWNSLAVTSPHPAASKSFTAINLALTIAAEYDKTALLIDADLGAPQLARLFGLGPVKGLTDHLLDGVPLAELVINPGIEHLVLLPAGKAVAQSAELLALDANTLLIDELKSRYAQRYILFDAPPVTSAEGLSLFEKVDAVLLVGERDLTSRQDLEKCRELLVPYNLIGAVYCEPNPELAGLRDATTSRVEPGVVRRGTAK